MKKLLVVIAGGIGYVLGTKAGRERYEQIMGSFNKVKQDPRVQEKAHQAADLAKEKAPLVKDKVSGAASKVQPGGRSGTHSSSSDSTSETSSTTSSTGSGFGSDGGAGLGSSDPLDQLNPESTIFQDNPGPKGDLP